MASSDALAVAVSVISRAHHRVTHQDPSVHPWLTIDKALSEEFSEALYRFAADAVAREREECAKWCDQYAARCSGHSPRSEGMIHAIELLAAAIRARDDAARPAEPPGED